MNPKNSARYSFKKAWSWPREVERKIAELIEGYSLHVCCGESTLGDIRINYATNGNVLKGVERTPFNTIRHLAENVVGDMYHLPVRQEAFDTVICDPPWELPYHLRGRLLRQLRDSLKPGGRLIFNCFWFPKTRGLSVDKEIFVGVPHNLWRNASLLVTARRMALPVSGFGEILSKTELAPPL